MNKVQLDNLLKPLIRIYDDIELEINKFKELWALYELYCAKMEKEHYIDFDDMIILVLKKY